jgi:flagellar biosynthesis anti-sigma factor FlgM
MRIPSRVYGSGQSEVSRTKEAGAQDKASRAKGSSSSRASAAGSDISVSVSSRAIELAGASNRDEARVEALRQAINDGTFQVDKERIAQAIVAGG